MKYSVFISYRRNESTDERKLMKNFNTNIKLVAKFATKIDNIFFDEDTIKWGKEFDEAIYDSIINSCFFVPFISKAYLDENHLWCARELYHAVEVEKKIRIHLNKSDFCYILPIIRIGSMGALPNCINTKVAVHLRQYVNNIINNKRTEQITKLFEDIIHNVFDQNYDLIQTVEIKNLCEDIKRPSDEEIIEWIKGCNASLIEYEKQNLPKY